MSNPPDNEKKFDQTLRYILPRSFILAKLEEKRKIVETIAKQWADAAEDDNYLRFTLRMQDQRNAQNLQRQGGMKPNPSEITEAKVAEAKSVFRQRARLLDEAAKSVEIQIKYLAPDELWPCDTTFLHSISVHSGERVMELADLEEFKRQQAAAQTETAAAAKN